MQASQIVPDTSGENNVNSVHTLPGNRGSGDSLLSSSVTLFIYLFFGPTTRHMGASSPTRD